MDEDNASLCSFLDSYAGDKQALRSEFVDNWVRSPNVRGTREILQSCLVTLVACVYTALHLNVPKNSAWHYCMASKIKWVFFSLVAPEVVLYMASDQLIQAWQMRKRLRELQAKSTTVDKDFNFDLRYAFFVAMHGVHIDVEDILSFEDLDLNFYFHFEHMKRPRTVCLEAHAVVKLAERGHWLYISRQRIDDKSKADYIEKTIVLTQIIWMVTQCITRYLYHLPVSLLEIHTMVHVVCALFLYACWFQKPLNVQQPEVVDPSEFLGEASQMVQHQFYSSWSTKLALFPPRSLEQPTPPPRYAQDGAFMRWYNPERSSAMQQGDIMPSGLALYRTDRELKLTPQFLKRWEAILKTFSFEDRDLLARATTFGEPQIGKRYLPTAQTDVSFEPPYLYRFAEFKSKLPFNDGKQNLEVKLDRHKGVIALAVILPVFYGGIHLTAWNRAFPTYYEDVFWKISCFSIVGGAPVMMLLAYILGDYDTEDNQSRIKDPSLRYLNTNWFLYSLIILGTICNVFVLSLYALARVYIVTEAFLSLRHVPIGVYQSPAWLQMFPHF